MGERQELAGMPVERLETLADGVFSIAMTLLVLQIVVPAVTEPELVSQLSGLWPPILIYGISFVVLGVYWVGHHYIFRVIQRSNLTLMWINIVYLMGVAIVPFCAALLGRYPLTVIANVVYGATLAATAGVAYGMWWYATDRHRLVDPNLDPALISFVSRRIATGPVASLVAIGLAFVRPELSILLYALLPPFYIVSVDIDRHYASLPKH